MYVLKISQVFRENFLLVVITCATKRGCSCLCEGRFSELSFDLELTTPLFIWAAAHLHSCCPWSSDYLPVLRENRNDTERERFSAARCDFSFLSVRLNLSLCLCFCCWGSCDSSPKQQGDSRTRLWKQAGCLFVFVFCLFCFSLCIQRRSCSSHVVSIALP